MKIKFKNTALFALGLVVFSVSADADLPEAPISVVKDFVYLCSDNAIEDGIPEDQLDSYILDCVNSELEEQDWKKIQEIPKDAE